MIPQPLIAVQDVEATRAWYQRVLGLTSGHGGAEYEQLMFGDRLVLQLHHWDAEEHPHLGDPTLRSRGNGVLLWFQTEGIEAAYDRALAARGEVIEPLKVNPLANHREFWLRDPNGYIIVVASPYGDLGVSPQTQGDLPA